MNEQEIKELQDLAEVIAKSLQKKGNPYLNVNITQDSISISSVDYFKPVEIAE